MHTTHIKYTKHARKQEAGRQAGRQASRQAGRHTRNQTLPAVMIAVAPTQITWRHKHGTHTTSIPPLHSLAHSFSCTHSLIIRALTADAPVTCLHRRLQNISAFRWRSCGWSQSNKQQQRQRNHPPIHSPIRSKQAIKHKNKNENKTS